MFSSYLAPGDSFAISTPICRNTLEGYRYTHEAGFVYLAPGF